MNKSLEARDLYGYSTLSLQRNLCNGAICFLVAPFANILNRFYTHCRCVRWMTRSIFRSLCAPRSFIFSLQILEVKTAPNHCLRRRVKNVNLYACLMCLKQIAICTCFIVTYVRCSISRWTFPRFSFLWVCALISCQLLVHPRKLFNSVDLWNGKPIIKQEIHESHRLGIQFFFCTFPVIISAVCILVIFRYILWRAFFLWRSKLENLLHHEPVSEFELLRLNNL